MSFDVERPEWMTWAECRGAPADIFHPAEIRGEAGELAVARAVDICRRCDVQVECLTHALNVPELDGIWGGKTPWQRRRIRRRRANREDARGPLPGDTAKPIVHGTLGGGSSTPTAWRTTMPVVSAGSSGLRALHTAEQS